MTTRRFLAGLLLMLDLTHTAYAQSTPAAVVQIEITHLLDFVGKSGCAFYRNGTWYDALSAQQHLRDKYNYLSSLSEVTSTDQFIEKVATQSSYTQIQYQVKCRDQLTLTSRLWLHDELLRWRQSVLK